MCDGQQGKQSKLTRYSRTQSRKQTLTPTRHVSECDVAHAIIKHHLSKAIDATSSTMPLIADHDSFYRTANFPLAHKCDMEAELKEEATDLCVAAAEKYKDNLDKATQVQVI